jgi:hypothetical protein
MIISHVESEGDQKGPMNRGALLLSNVCFDLFFLPRHCTTSVASMGHVAAMGEGGCVGVVVVVGNAALRAEEAAN